MATERRLALAALALFAGGCTNVNRCRSQTILVSVTLDAATARADTLQVDVAIDGSANRSTVTHAAGSAAGTIEVRFPSGYPTGKSVSIHVVGLQAAVPLGDGTASLTAPAGCTTAMVAIASGGTRDQDLAATSDDLAGGSPGADLACPSSVEDCFNGVDDNCDGLVDCADPQCTPTAECVPDPGSATAGTLSATASPSRYPTATPLYSGLNAGTCASGTLHLQRLQRHAHLRDGADAAGVDARQLQRHRHAHLQQDQRRRLHPLLGDVVDDLLHRRHAAAPGHLQSAVGRHSQDAAARARPSPPPR